MPRKPSQLGKLYKGDLNKAIKVPPPPHPPTILSEKPDYESSHAKHKKEVDEIISREVSRKMPVLLDHYELDANDADVWYKLALKLAINHVPGFDLYGKRQSGRKSTWNFISHAKLYFDVLRETKGQLEKENIQAACYHLLKKEPWTWFLQEKGFKKPSAKTLQNQFSAARRSPLVKMFEALPNDHKAKQAFYDHVESVFEESLIFFPVNPPS